ncbi:tail fiber domain-containing protein, partial [Flammeovirga sp. EKP202]|uniref:tail fiber domain-containing protein n=1 Tax=Flammeovirga sp. EKP202 TaxID=2770592 RepID=UPI00165FEC27
SAYDLAFKSGFEGTESEWLLSLQGEDGIDAYTLAQESGFKGTKEEWLASLQGSDGQSAYDLAFKSGFEGTESEWLLSLQGEDGVDAYTLAQESGFKGTKEEWLASLQGSDGQSAYDLAFKSGFEGTESEWLSSLKGDQGNTGLSAYDLAFKSGFEGTQDDWLKSLKGDQGDTGLTGATGVKGADGLSAYQIWLNNENSGTEEDFLQSLEATDTNLSESEVDAYVANNGYITGVTAGNGLIGGGSTGNTTLNVVANNGLTTAADQIQLGGALVGNTTISAGTNNFNINLNNTGNFSVVDGAAYRLFVRNDGAIAIGHSSPTRALDINGRIRIRGGSPGDNKVLTSSSDGTAEWSLPITQVNGGKGMTGSITSGNGTLNVVAENGLKASDDKIELGGDLSKETTINSGDGEHFTVNLKGSGNFAVEDNGNTAFFVKNNGDVAIGTDDMTAKLEVHTNNNGESPGFEIDNSGSGDVAMRFRATSGGKKDFTVGIDDSDGDQFKISRSSKLEGDSPFVINTDGQVGIRRNPDRDFDIKGNTRVLHGTGNVDDNNGFALQSGESGPRWIFHVSNSDDDLELWSKPSGDPKKDFIFLNGGNLQIRGNLTTKVDFSDIRLKENIDTVKTTLNAVKQLGVYSYNYKTDPDSVRYYGFIAQELMQYFPENVDLVEKTGYYSVNYKLMVPVLTKAVQEQQDMIEDLEKENSDLEQKMKDLETKVEANALQNEKVNDLFLKLQARIQELENANASLEQK